MPSPFICFSFILTWKHECWLANEVVVSWQSRHSGVEKYSTVLHFIILVMTHVRVLRNVFGELHTIATNSGRHIYKVKKIKIDVMCCMNTTSLLSLQLQNKKSIILYAFPGLFPNFTANLIVASLYCEASSSRIYIPFGNFSKLKSFFLFRDSLKYRYKHSYSMMSYFQTLKLKFILWRCV